MTSPIILIDFDQTITQKDTIAILGQTALDLNHHSKSWSYFTDSYLDDYRKHKAQLPELPKHDFTAYLNQLESYRPIEKASLARVSAHKVFKGISQNTLNKAAKEQSSKLLQPHVLSVLQEHQEAIRVVSLNWSKDWILGMLHPLNLSRQQIYSNDLEFIKEEATGEIMAEILTTGDKKRAIDASKKDAAVIYIGDSTGDMLPLGKNDDNISNDPTSNEFIYLYIVESQVGIIIGQDGSLLKALNDYGFKVQEQVNGQVNGIYRVDNWLQINDIITRFKQLH
jgi:2-hydroxy-3-keto-5-methylthiopentenyl-1-phosphate phosphatase